MFSIENLTNLIANKISLELKFDNDQKEVVAYGLFALFHTTLSIALVIIFGFIFGVWFEALAISLAGSILRKYSGGVHTSSPGTCAMVGTIIAVGEAIIISFMLASLINLKLVILIGILSFAWCYYIILKLAPVDSASKPIKTEKKKKRMKKGSILILDAYLVTVILNVLLFLYTHRNIFLVSSMCIYGGTVWQAFTLTRGGHLTIWKIDTFITQILALLRREK